MDKSLKQFMEFFDSIVGTKEAGIVEMIVGIVVILIAVAVIKVKNKKK